MALNSRCHESHERSERIGVDAFKEFHVALQGERARSVFPLGEENFPGVTFVGHRSKIEFSVFGFAGEKFAELTHVDIVGRAEVILSYDTISSLTHTANA